MREGKSEKCGLGNTSTIIEIVTLPKHTTVLIAAVLYAQCTFTPKPNHWERCPTARWHNVG
jgi:hypothetical protein